jgi:predicted DNA-binding transcriptional regulator AlpA
MSEPEAPQGKLYTLSEISQKTGISMPTLQRYKKMYQGRIPAEGKGRKQRYPESALPIFDELRNENLGRRGRPRKDASAPRPERTATKAAKSSGQSGRGGRKAAAAKETRQTGGRKAGSKAPAPAAPAPAARGGRGRKAATSGGGTGRGNLMTLTQISEQTGISYPTLVRYVRMHADRLPHEGKGRGRRFYPEAVNVFRQLREESGRGGRKPSAAKVGRPAGRPAASGRGRGAAPAARGGRTGGEDAGILQRLREIEKSNLNLEKRFRDFAKSLQRLLR